jgi:hypothetical protein
MPEQILKILQILVLAEPAVVNAIHNLLTGTGTADDITILKADAIAWQAIVDHATAQIAAAKNPAPITQ